MELSEHMAQFLLAPEVPHMGPCLLVSAAKAVVVVVAAQAVAAVPAQQTLPSAAADTEQLLSGYPSVEGAASATAGLVLVPAAMDHCRDCAQAISPI